LLRQGFDQLGSALKAGDLTAAQQAFAALEQTQGLRQAGAAGFAGALQDAAATVADSGAADASAPTTVQQAAVSDAGEPDSASSSGQLLESVEQQRAFGHPSVMGRLVASFHSQAPWASQIRSDSQALGEALQSGDLALAQQDFTQLLQALDRGRHGHPHSHPVEDTASTHQQQNAASAYAAVSSATAAVTATKSSATSADASGAAASSDTAPVVTSEPVNAAA
jgi:hypothetical protein